MTETSRTTRSRNTPSSKYNQVECLSSWTCFRISPFQAFGGTFLLHSTSCGGPEAHSLLFICVFFYLLLTMMNTLVSLANSAYWPLAFYIVFWLLTWLYWKSRKIWVIGTLFFWFFLTPIIWFLIGLYSGKATDESRKKLTIIYWTKYTGGAKTFLFNKIELPDGKIIKEDTSLPARFIKFFSRID